MKAEFQIDPSIAEIGIVDEALHRDETAAETINDLVRPHKDLLLTRLLARKPEIVRALCYLDVLFLLPQRPTGISRSFCVAPTQGAVDKYDECISALVTGGFDFAGHPVFQYGLPRLTDLSRAVIAEPKTKNDLAYFFRNVRTRTETVTERFLVADVEQDSSELRSSQATESAGSRSAGDFAWKASGFRRQHTEAQYGGPERSVLDNFRKYASLLFENREIFSDYLHRPLRIVVAIPFSYWRRIAGGQTTVIPGGSLLLGMSRKIDDEERRVISDIVAGFIGQGYLVPAGSQQQQVNFAHQTSAVIDSILDSVERLPDDIRKAMGGKLLGKLYLLRATVTSYRSKESRVDPGDFVYPWGEDENPLAVYRDIGIELGLARCEDAPREEEAVRVAGKLALQEVNKIGEPGFENYRRLFLDVPNVPEDLLKYLKHSSFAVLILLTIKQAFYHTIRARVLGNLAAAIELRVRERVDGLIFECTVKNSRVTEKDQELESKDAAELRELADRLSHIPDNPSSYSVVGPFFSRDHNCWLTTTRIQERETEELAMEASRTSRQTQ